MKKLELVISQAWQNQSKWLRVLAPVSALYGAVTYFRRYLYDKSVLPAYRASVPVLVVGNITVGGSGKTPLIIALVRYLQSHNVAVGVISRGYGRKDHAATLVKKDSTPDEVGDEPCLIVQSTTVPMAVGANRKDAIELLQQSYPDIDLIISDDGLQHYALRRDAEWIVVDTRRGFGNQKLLPQGFLREPICHLDGAVVIYHQAPKACNQDLCMHLQPRSLMPLLDSQAKVPPKNTTVYALSGIGYPVRFFETLQELGFTVIPKPFADHHVFTINDVLLTDYPVVVTSKDAVKLRQLAKHLPHQAFENIWVLPVEAVLSQGVYDTLDALLKRWKIT